MDFTLITKKGTKIEIPKVVDSVEIVIEIDGVKYRIAIAKINK